jgi:hypothetical protein
MVSSAATNANTASPAGDTQHRHHLPRNNDPERDLLSRRQRTKNHLIAVVGEYVGTTLFLWFSFAGTQACAITGGGVANTPDQVVLTSLAFGFSLLVTVWAFYRISGGLFNPAVCYSPTRDLSLLTCPRARKPHPDRTSCVTHVHRT